MRYQQAFAGQDIDALPYEEYLQRTADAFGWKVGQLQQTMEKKHLTLEFLRQPEY
ncbi:MAG TPA: hypothetical protein PKW33_02540 [Anaerolineaceae bacterium]|nr:hypothetical protein [Anaerolineaceae bacterium]HPN50439.1 hypothetical protein [Anaerolineaceae bacterium]